ncbi:MAG: hypothetical protein FWF30_01340 [Coriobacteriia bacterium]|nr:hypothetical protein [Coriobacteriia bacterium]
MQFGLSKPLQKFLKIKQLLPADMSCPFYCWSLHRTKYHGRSTLIAMNISNRYALLFTGLQSADWEDIDGLVLDGIKQAFLREGYSNEQTGQYLKAAGAVEFSKLHGDKALAGLKSIISMLKWLDVALVDGQFFQPLLSRELNSESCYSFDYDDYGYPSEFLAKDMQRVLQTDSS